MATIYSLQTDGLIWYVGSTTNPSERERHHRAGKQSCSSTQIPIEFEWEFKILETCELPVRFIRERYYYELLKPLYNFQVPGRTDEEYKQDNKEQYKIKKHEYYLKNREKMKESSKRSKEARKEQVREYNRLWRAKKKSEGIILTC